MTEKSWQYRRLNLVIFLQGWPLVDSGMLIFKIYIVEFQKKTKKVNWIIDIVLVLVERAIVVTTFVTKNMMFT